MGANDNEDDDDLRSEINGYNTLQQSKTEQQ